MTILDLIRRSLGKLLRDEMRLLLFLIAILLQLIAKAIIPELSFLLWCCVCTLCAASGVLIWFSVKE